VYLKNSRTSVILRQTMRSIANHVPPSFGFDTGPESFPPLVYRLVNNGLFEVRPVFDLMT